MRCCLNDKKVFRNIISTFLTKTLVFITEKEHGGDFYIFIFSREQKIKILFFLFQFAWLKNKVCWMPKRIMEIMWYWVFSTVTRYNHIHNRTGNASRSGMPCILLFISAFLFSQYQNATGKFVFNAFFTRHSQ